MGAGDKAPFPPSTVCVLCLKDLKVAFHIPCLQSLQAPALLEDAVDGSEEDEGEGFRPGM